MALIIYATLVTIIAAVSLNQRDKAEGKVRYYRTYYGPHPLDKK